MKTRLVLGSFRELGTVGLVSALCAGYAAVLVMTSATLAATSSGTGATAVLLGAVGTVFILIAVYISAVVITNCVDTVIAGRLPQIALLRLLGARARGLRRVVMRGTAAVGLVGAAIGTVAGTAAADVFRIVLVKRDTLPDVGYPLVAPSLVLPVFTIGGVAALAGWIGSSSVLRVSPAAALSDIASAPSPAPRRTVIRAASSLLLVLGGSAVLVLASVRGEDGGQDSFVLAFAGAAISGTGLLIGARYVIPGLVKALSRILGRTPASRVAGRNAVKDPLRTTRSTMGLVVGVALVTTFASGMRALEQSVGSWIGMTVAEQAQTRAALSMASTVLIAIVVISSIISAVGFVSTMSLTVVQRQREIGLLRTLGFTRRQISHMITFESAALSGTAVALGLALGLVYGSVGAQALVGRVTAGFVWGLPWGLLAAIAVAGVALVFAAARPPTRRAVRITPIEALRVA